MKHDLIINRLYSVVCHLSSAPLHLSRFLYKSALFMQNKPNFRKPKMNLSLLATMDYENISDWTLGENKPKQTQRYIKNGSGDGGEDRGWVNFMHRTGPTPTQDTTNWHGFIWEMPVNNCHSERKRSVSFGAFEIDISNLFRISDFYIRICCP